MSILSELILPELSRCTEVKTSKDEPCHALDIFLASYPFIDTNTPEIIVQKISEAIDDLRGTKGWEEKPETLRTPVSKLHQRNQPQRTWAA